MSPTVTIPKIKYKALKEKANAYETLQRAMMRGGFFEIPPTKKSSEIVKALRKSKRYNKKFIGSIKRGLRRSGYFI